MSLCECGCIEQKQPQLSALCQNSVIPEFRLLKDSVDHWFHILLHEIVTCVDLFVQKHHFDQ